MTLVPPIRWLVTDIALKAGSPIMATDFFQLPEAAGANGLVEHPRDWHCKVHGAHHGGGDASAAPVLQYEFQDYPKQSLKTWFSSWAFVSYCNK